MTLLATFGYGLVCFYLGFFTAALVAAGKEGDV